VNKVYDWAELAGRVLLSLIFIQSGFGKLTGYAGTQAYMESAGVPGILLPLVIIVELVGGLAIVVGWRTRLWAVLLAGFSLLSALLFHFKPDEQMQMILFMKNVAIAGGFLLLVAHGAGALSLDARSRR
jgi:putative oxidoreductase